MYRLQQSYWRSSFVRVAFICMVACLLLLPAAKALAAVPTTQAIANTINAKCTVVVTKDSRKKYGSEDAFKALVESCDGVGSYLEGATHKAQRAQRLLDICTGYSFYLEAYGAYSTKGEVDGGDCAKIADNTDLANLTKNLKDYPASSLGFTDDPALDCAADPDEGNKCDIMKKYVNPFIEFLSVFVGLAVTIGIISGGIRYISAGDDPQKVSAAKNMIRSAIIALVAFIFLYAAIQWMIPQTG